MLPDPPLVPIRTCADSVNRNVRFVAGVDRGFEFGKHISGGGNAAAKKYQRLAAADVGE